jgi:hypothetical protein
MAGEVVGGVQPKSLTGGHLKDSANILRTQMQGVSLDIFELDLFRSRKHDDLSAGLPSAPTGTYLGIVTGTYGSGAPTIQTGDLKAAGATTRRLRQIVSLPNYYVAGEQSSIYVAAGMDTTIADGSATLLVEAYEIEDDGTLGSNLAGAAQDINSLTPATLNFPLTSTGLVPGSRLDVRMSITVTDAATATAVIGKLLAAYLKCKVQP